MLNNILREHDATILYAIFAIQCLLVFIGFPYLINQCVDQQKRFNLSYGRWMAKWMFVSYVGKWMIDTYDLVEIQYQQDGLTNMSAFEPYKLLKLEDDGSFDTEIINANFQRLQKKYHPKNVNSNKVPYLKAVRRYENLIKAYETLTQPTKFVNWQEFGDPEGSKTITALGHGFPKWIFEEDFKPMLITWAFCGCIAIFLGFYVWKSQSRTRNAAGIEKDSQFNMKEFILAILEDNNKSQRTVGLSDMDMVEVFEQSLEIMQLNDNLEKKATFADILKWMIKRTAEQAGTPAASGGDACCGESGPRTPDQIISDLLPKLTETLLDALCDEPFNGQSIYVPQSGDGFKFKGEALMTSILAYIRQVNGAKLLNKRKITIIAPEDALFGDVNIKVDAQRLPFVKEPHGTRKRVFVALCNTSDGSMYVQEDLNETPRLTQTFKIKSTTKGKANFRAYIVSGDGQIERAKTDVEVLIGGEM